MEDSKPHCLRLLTPSLAMLLVTASSILCTFGRLSSRPSELSIGAALLAAGLAVLAPVLKKRTPLRASGPLGHGRKKDRLPIGTYLGAAAALLLLFVLMSWRTGREVFIPGESVRAGSSVKRVVSVERARYGSRAVVAEVPDPGAAAPDEPRSLVHVHGGISLSAGDTIHIDGNPRPITPSDIASSPYRRGLARRGIGRIYRPGRDNLWIIQTRKDSTKKRIRRSLEKSIDNRFPADTARLLKSLYFGNKHYMDKLTLERYRRAGVMHVLAASGLHVGIIAAIPFLLLAPLRIDKRVILALGLASAALYLYITDVPISLLRAFVMFALYGMLSMLSIGRTAVNTLFLTGTLVLLMFPDELYGMGFQLSFGATLGILLFHRTFTTILGGLPRFIANAMALTLAAQVPVFLILFLHVGEVNLAGFFSNLLVVPAVSLTLVASLGTLALSPLSDVLAAVGRFITHGAGSVGTAAASFMAGTGLHFSVPSAGAVLLLPYILYLASMAPFSVPLRARRALLSLSFAAAALILTRLQPGLPEHAVFSMTRGGVHILTRADHALLYGSITSVVEAQRLLDYLAEHGVATVQLCIPTADFSNMAGFGHVVRHATVTGCILGDGYSFSRAMTDFMELLETDRITPDIRRVSDIAADEHLRRACELLYAPPPDISPFRRSPVFLSKLFKSPTPFRREKPHIAPVSPGREVAGDELDY